MDARLDRQRLRVQTVELVELANGNRRSNFGTVITCLVCFHLVPLRSFRRHIGTFHQYLERLPIRAPFT